MTPATLSRFGRCFVCAGFARRAEKRARVQILEHLAHQECTEKYEHADNDCSHHGVSLSMVSYRASRVEHESGDKMVRMQRFLARVVPQGDAA